MMDWGEGNYARIAQGLLPGSKVAVEVADPRPGERVLDLGCGTGNAALLAAERGAIVTGVDPSQRLLDVAHERAKAANVDVSFRAGKAEATGLTDACADIVMSVFGVIFAPDAHAAAEEMSRVAAEDGRIVLGIWIPGGALFEVIGERRRAMAAAAGTSDGPPPFAWHEPDALGELFAPYGFSLAVQEHTLPFTAESPKDFLDGELRDHPMWIVGRALLEPRGEWQALYGRALEIYSSANEQPDGFRVNSRYLVASLSR